MAPARCLAHWTITQRTVHVVLADKTALLSHEKPFCAGTIGEAIRTARIQAGLTQEKLAELTGIHRQWLGRWERGRAVPSFADLDKLKTVLGSSVVEKFAK